MNMEAIQSTILKISKVHDFINHFNIPPDLSHWNRQYVDCFSSKGKKEGMTPNRIRADFKTHTKSLMPVTEFAKSLNKTYGLYFVASDAPERSLYIGIAARSKSPEGILQRLRKHRVKVTGSHVGSGPQKCGINHTVGWREMAIKRHQYVTQPDFCEDIRFAIGEIECDEFNNHKDVCEYFEWLLTKDVNYRGKIINLFWPGMSLDDVYIITSQTTNSRNKPNNAKVIFPDVI